MIAGLGHNNGPTLESGTAWRKHCWKKARTDLIPNLPIEILRGRVRRAQDLGLEYKTYASVRASTGRDVIGFLFSSNALRVLKAGQGIPEDRVARLTRLQSCDRAALVSRPLHPADFATAIAQGQLEFSAPAPVMTDTWSTCRETIQAALRQGNLPRDGVILIGDTTLEREWSEAGRLAAYLPAPRYFDGPDQSAV